MTVRTDLRLLDTPMRPVHCQQCRARVEVRKSSRYQTSIQWDSAAVAACEERRATPEGRGGHLDACQALRDSIRQAVAEGAIEVPDDKY